MLIKILRVYIGSGDEGPVVINTDYIITIESTGNADKPNTRIIIDSQRPHNEGPTFIYTDESVDSLDKRINKKPSISRKK